jgi:hypothetical protein
MQWLIVSVIVSACAVLALRAAVVSVRRWFGHEDRDAAGGSGCGGCGGCRHSESEKRVPIVALGTKVRS